MANFHDFHATTIDGTEQSLREFAGKAVLVVNVASRCGLTPHYQGLEALHRELAPKGLVVVGFPCNQFGAQEPGTEAEIKEFCSLTYDVTFPLFAKVDVNGEARHPLYAFLTGADSGPEGAGDIVWNFTKFLIDRQGNVAARFAPMTEPGAEELRAAIDKVL
jgi:glutathione peroxidase